MISNVGHCFTKPQYTVISFSLPKLKEKNKIVKQGGKDSTTNEPNDAK